MPNYYCIVHAPALSTIKFLMLKIILFIFQTCQGGSSIVSATKIIQSKGRFSSLESRTSLLGILLFKTEISCKSLESRTLIRRVKSTVTLNAMPLRPIYTESNASRLGSKAVALSSDFKMALVY